MHAAAAAADAAENEGFLYSRRISRTSEVPTRFFSIAAAAFFVGTVITVVVVAAKSSVMRTAAPIPPLFWFLGGTEPYTAAMAVAMDRWMVGCLAAAAAVAAAAVTFITSPVAKNLLRIRPTNNVPVRARARAAYAHVGRIGIL